MEKELFFQKEDVITQCLLVCIHRTNSMSQYEAFV